MLALKYFKKKSQGIRGGPHEILCRHQWVEKQTNKQTKQNKTKQNKTKQNKTKKNPGMPNFYKVNSRVQVTTLLVHKE